MARRLLSQVIVDLAERLRRSRTGLEPTTQELFGEGEVLEVQHGGRILVKYGGGVFWMTSVTDEPMEANHVVWVAESDDGPFVVGVKK